MEKKDEFQHKYENLAYLLFVSIDTPMLKAMLHFQDASYHYFTFNQHDMTLTIVEYDELFNIKKCGKGQSIF